jgi:hypothetical protein
MSTLSDHDVKNRLEHGVWLDEIDRAFRAWRAAPNVEKADLLLQGPILTWAENWRMTNAHDFAPSVETYITRSLSAQSSKTSAERAAKDKELVRRDKVYQQLLLMMALFAIVTLAPQMMRLYFAPSDQEPVQTAENERRQTADAPSSGQQRASSAIVDATEPFQPPMEYWSAGRMLDFTRSEANVGNTRAASLYAIEALDSLNRMPAKSDHKERLQALSALTDLAQRQYPLSFAGGTLDLDRAAHTCADTARSIGVSTNQQLIVLDAARRTATASISVPAFNANSLDAACTQLLVVGQDYDLSILPLDTARKPKTLGTHDAAIVGQAFSRDGRRVVSVSRDAVGKVWDANTGRRIATFRSDAQVFAGAAINDDGTRIVSWSDDQTAELYDANSGKRLGAYEGHQGAVIAARFSSDGKTLLTVSVDGTAILWDSATRAKLTTYRPRGGSLVDAWQLPDGQHVATRLDDNRLQVWNRTSDTPTADLTLPDSKIQHVVVSPNGRRLAIFEPGGRASVIETATGELVLSVSLRSGELKGGFFSPDGASLTGFTSDGLVTWPLLETRDQAIKTLDATAHCWTTDERIALRLNPIVPDWCLTSGTVTRADPLP